MKIDEQTILQTAALARLELTPDELAEFTRQLSDIIAYVDKINELDTDQVTPALPGAPLYNVVREDKPGPCLDRAAVEQMAPRFDQGHFVVPRIMEGKA